MGKRRRSWSTINKSSVNKITKEDVERVIKKRKEHFKNESSIGVYVKLFTNKH